MSFRTPRVQASASPGGMVLTDHSRNAFLELQRKKVYRYVIFKIDEKKKEVVVEKTGNSAQTYSDFSDSLPQNDCRYAVYDFDFVTAENCQKSKIFFIAWSPQTSGIRARMLYAMCKDRFKRELDGFHYEIQATDPTEMDLEVLRNEHDEASVEKLVILVLNWLEVEEFKLKARPTYVNMLLLWVINMANSKVP